MVWIYSECKIILEVMESVDVEVEIDMEILDDE